MSRNRALFAAIVAMTSTVAPANAATCSAESSRQRVALLELYTSEGCDSCPPADRWISALPDRGLTPERVVALGFHVDYWNDLGWNDPYAKAEYGVRQRVAVRRQNGRAVYTPQLVLNGRDFRRGIAHETLLEQVNAINRDPARARIRLRLVNTPSDSLAVSGSVSVPDVPYRYRAQAYLALYENDLSTDVKAGENRGKRLRHDFVVREMAGPYAIDRNGSASWDHRFRLGAGWKPGHLHVAVFVQNDVTGEVLQSMALRNCP